MNHSINVNTYLSIYPSIDLPIHLSIDLSIHLSIYQSIHPFIYTFFKKHCLWKIGRSTWQCSPRSLTFFGVAAMADPLAATKEMLRLSPRDQRWHESTLGGTTWDSFNGKIIGKIWGNHL
jgi:hypothetical protein